MTNIGFVSKQADARIEEILELIRQDPEDVLLEPGTEIDSRVFEGHVGSVTLRVVYGGFEVLVFDHNGYVVFSRTTTERAIAAQLYLHPFSLPEVQSLWEAEAMLH